jgi:hypothetical protein
MRSDGVVFMDDGRALFFNAQHRCPTLWATYTAHDHRLVATDQSSWEHCQTAASKLRYLDLEDPVLDRGVNGSVTIRYLSKAASIGMR